MNKREVVGKDYISASMNENLRRLVDTLIKKRTAYMEASNGDNQELAEQKFTEYRNMMKEISLTHPEFDLSSIDKDFLADSEDLNAELHDKPNYRLKN